MRKRYRVLVFAALVAALIVPVGYALSIDSRPNALNGYAAVVPAAAAAVAAPTMPRISDAAPLSMLFEVSDSAKLLCIGTVLFGLAAAMRKAI
jgi:hypothetical protein